MGFAGEWFAYRWLERQYGADFSPECWVSGYRERVSPGTGDDSLGWDFEIPGRRGNWYYEVKTTLAEGGRIELGETQVIAAQENARNRRWRLLVKTNVMNENRQIRMLPNLFDPATAAGIASSARVCVWSTAGRDRRYLCQRRDGGTAREPDTLKPVLNYGPDSAC